MDEHEYSALSDADLIRLVFIRRDRLPMAFAREVLRRGLSLVPALSDIVRNRANWEASDETFWAVIHASFLLGAIGGEAVVPVFSDVLRYSVEFDNDWVAEELPSIFGALGSSVIPFLKEAAGDRGQGWYFRDRALSGLASITLRHPDYAEEIFAFIARMAGESGEDDDLRAWAGCVLLDFGRREHEPLLRALVEEGVAAGHFSEKHIQEAMEKGNDLHWYRRDWLDFYSDPKLEERRKRWEEEDSSYYEGLSEDTGLRKEKVTEILEPAEVLVRRLRNVIGKREAKSSQADLTEQYALAMELQDYIEKRGKSEAFRVIERALESVELSDWLIELPIELSLGGMIREAESMARRWAEITEAENFLGDLAVSLAKSGMGEKAREQVAENLRRFPGDVWVRIKAGDAHRELGAVAEAESLYRASLEMAHENFDRDGVLERLVPLLRGTGREAEARSLEADEQRRRAPASVVPQPHVRRGPKIGRNAPCPCGSGKKYKKCCHGNIEARL